MSLTVTLINIDFSTAQVAKKVTLINVLVCRIGSPRLISEYNAIIAFIFGGFPMATMTIRNLDDELKARLRLRAARHGQSMEEEARSILRSALQVEPLAGSRC